MVNGRSLRSAARDLTGAGWATRRGNVWNANTLKQALLAERNAGPVVQRSVWSQVRDILTDPERSQIRGAKYLIRFLVCDSSSIRAPSSFKHAEQ